MSAPKSSSSCTHGLWPCIAATNSAVCVLTSFQLRTRSRHTSASGFKCSVGFLLDDDDRTDEALDLVLTDASVMFPGPPDTFPGSSQIISGVDGVVDSVVVDTEVPLLVVSVFVFSLPLSSSLRNENCCCWARKWTVCSWFFDAARCSGVRCSKSSETSWVSWPLETRNVHIR